MSIFLLLLGTTATFFRLEEYSNQAKNSRSSHQSLKTATARVESKQWLVTLQDLNIFLNFDNRTTTPLIMLTSHILWLARDVCGELD